MTMTIDRRYDPDARKWTERPALSACWRGAKRLWFADESTTPVDESGKIAVVAEVSGEAGTCYQNQLWCDYWQCFINPGGATCEQCTLRLWPMVEMWRAHTLPYLIEKLGKEKAAETVLEALASGELTEAEALALGEEFKL